MARLSCISSSSEPDSSDLTVDRLSMLPCDLLNIIFSYLTIIDAVRSSVLAKDWRYKWLSFSDLIVDYNLISNILKIEYPRWDIVASIISRYLLHHIDSIRTFALRGDISSHYSDMYQWIQHLSKRNVETLSIHEFGQEFFEMSSQLFSFDKLKNLHLSSCTLRVPPSFRGFNYLRVLYLRGIIFSNDDLNRLILACPILEELSLLYVYGVKILFINAPRLRALMVDSRIEDIVIQAAPSLTVVSSICAIRLPGEIMVFNSYGIIRNFFGLGALQRLTLSGDLIKLLAAGYETWKFSWTNVTLSFLSIEFIKFENVKVIRVCLSLLSSCPNLKYFCFSAVSTSGATLIRSFLKNNRRRFTFPELNSVEMLFPGGVDLKCTVNFLEFIGAHSPKLEFLNIVKNDGFEYHPFRISKLLARLKKSCPHAKVTYVHLGRDRKITYYNSSN